MFVCKKFKSTVYYIKLMILLSPIQYNITKYLSRDLLMLSIFKNTYLKI